MFHEIFYRPLFNILVFIYNLVPGADFGLAIIILTVLIRIVLFPLSIKGARSQKALAEIGPELSRLKEKYKNDQAAYSAAALNLYKERGINPVAGCLPILIQLPIIFALYRVFLGGVNENNISDLYSFISAPASFDTLFLGIFNTSQKYWFFAPLIGAIQFIQSKMSLVKAQPGAAPSAQDAMNRQMLYVLPFILIIISWNLPTGVNLYLIATTLFSLFEQWHIRRKHK